MCLVYVHVPKKLLKSSIMIHSQKGLKMSINLWRKRIKIDKDAKIFPRFLDKNSDEKMIGICKKCGGACVELLGKIGDKKYKIYILKSTALKTNRKPDNWAGLLHELLHIKFGHCEKEKKFPYSLPIIHSFAEICFNIKVNKELTKYEKLLKRRKFNYNL